MKITPPSKSGQLVKPDRVFNRCWIIMLVIVMGLALLLGTSGFQTYWSKERRLIAAANEIVAALKAYSDVSPGTAMDFPLELADLRHDPRMLAEVSYLSVLPVDPVAQNQEWGVVRNDKNQVIGYIADQTKPQRFSRNSFPSAVGTGIRIGSLLRSERPECMNSVDCQGHGRMHRS